MIAVLEDDRGRTEAMRSALRTALPATEVAFFDSAPDMIAWLKGNHTWPTGNLSRVCLLCLDHDLGPSRPRDGKRIDPGIGRDVVDFLITRPPACPVIIHSSNSIGANGMVSALESAGWSAERVVPHDDLAWVTDPWSLRVQAEVERIMRPGMQVPDSEYSKLESHLFHERWKDADDATRAILCTLTGRELHLVPEAIPLLRCEDLRRIDALWEKHSNGRYGFAAQSRIWAEVGGIARVLLYEDMSRDDKVALGRIEARYLKRVGIAWGPVTYGPNARKTDPTQQGHFPIASHLCSYGGGLIGTVLAAFARRLLDCGLVGSDVVFTDQP